MIIHVLTAEHIELPARAVLDQLVATNEEMASRVFTGILHVLENGGRPTPPISERISGEYNQLYEIRTRHDGDNLLRILYFVHFERGESRLVLLNCIIKPDGTKFPAYYEGAKGDRLRADIKESLSIADDLRKKYLSQQSYYEPL